MLTPMRYRLIKKKKQTKALSIPSELINNVVVHTKTETLRKLLAYQNIHSCLSSDTKIWNGYAKTHNLSIDQCKEMLKKRFLLTIAISKGLATVKTFQTKQSDITQLMICNGLIYSSSDDQSLKVFDFKGNCVKKFTGHSGGIWTFSTDGNTLITGSTDKTARIWHVETQELIKSLKLHRSTIRTLLFYNNYVITGSRDHSIAVWNSSGDLLHVLDLHTQSVRCLDISDDYLVSGSYDCTVKLWDYKKGKFIKDLAHHKKRVYVVKIHKEYIASGGLDFEVRISSIDGTYNIGYSYHSSIVAWIDFHDNFVISGSLDGSLVKYNYIDRKLEYTIQEQSPLKTQRIFNGLLLIATITEAKVYNLKTGNLIRVLIKADHINKIEMEGWKIAVGYCNGGEYKISIFDYDYCK
jgi:WD40 repeat protein